MGLCELAFASFQEVDWLRLWLGPALWPGWLRGGLSCMDARLDWFLLGGLVPGMTGGKGVMAGGQTDWFVLRPSLFIGRLPGAGADTRRPVRWLADRRAALLPCVFLRMVCRTDAGGWGDEPPPPHAGDPRLRLRQERKKYAARKRTPLEKTGLFSPFSSTLAGKEKHGGEPKISL